MKEFSRWFEYWASVLSVKEQLDDKRIEKNQNSRLNHPIETEQLFRVVYRYE